MKWQKLTIGDLGRVVTGKTPPTGNRAFYDGQYPFVTPTDLDWQSYVVRSTHSTVTELARDKNKNQFIPANATVFTCIGNTIGKTGLSATDCLTNQQINSVVPNDKHDPKFVYYLLNYHRPAIRSVGLGNGAAQPIINKSTFARVTVATPANRDEEQRIAIVLSAYDDLIENNRRRIALLEDAARQLYKEWFVRFRFPGHEHVRIINGVPEGWERLTLREVATLHYGKALKEETRIPGDIPVYGSSGVVGHHDKALVSGPGIVLGRKGNVGSVRWSHSDFFPIDTVYFVAKEQANFHLYLTLQHMHFMSTDVAVPGLNRDFAYSRTLVRPSAKVGERFEDEVTPIFDQVQKLTDWIEKLARARDLLLPKLMSGAIAV